MQPSIGTSRHPGKSSPDSPASEVSENTLRQCRGVSKFVAGVMFSLLWLQPVECLRPGSMVSTPSPISPLDSTFIGGFDEKTTCRARRFASSCHPKYPLEMFLGFTGQQDHQHSDCWAPHLSLNAVQRISSVEWHHDTGERLGRRK